MKIDYNTSKEIAQQFYEHSFSQWRKRDITVYEAMLKAEYETLSLRVNPFTCKDELDLQAINDFVMELMANR